MIGQNIPLISSAHCVLTRALNTSRTWASWVADSGSGLREGMERRFSSAVAPPSCLFPLLLLLLLLLPAGDDEDIVDDGCC